jgi:hypothetical protein
LFKSKRRIASAWAKGLMFGKAVGSRDERDRIIELLQQEKPCPMKGTHHDIGFCSCLAIGLIKGRKDD